MARHGLSDQAWQLIEPLFPPEKPPKQGRPWESHRRVVHGILWILRTGAPWRDLNEEEFGPWETVYGRFRRWCREGLWERVVSALQLRLLEDGRIELDLWCVDGSVIRAARCAAGAPKKTSPANQRTTPWAVRKAVSARKSTSKPILAARSSVSC